MFNPIAAFRVSLLPIEMWRKSGHTPQPQTGQCSIQPGLCEFGTKATAVGVEAEGCQPDGWGRFLPLT